MLTGAQLGLFWRVDFKIDVCQRKFSTTFYWGKHPFKDEGKLVFYPPHLNLTFAHKSQGGAGPPLVCPEGKIVKEHLKNVIDT